MKKIALLTLLSIFCFCFSSTAQNTIGFGSQGWTNAQDLNNFLITNNGQEFRFTSTSNSPGFEHRASSSFCGYSDNFVLFTGGSVTSATIATTDGTEFDLISLDFINDFICFNCCTLNVTITGYRNGAPVSGASYNKTNTGLSTTMDVSGDSDFDAVDSIRITANANMDSHGLDNFVWNTASAPCTMTASITSQTNVACNGGSTGSLTVTQSSGTSNFQYSWSNGASTSNTSSSTNTISSLAAGTYTVTVTDGNSCIATASATITQPSSALVSSANVSSAIDCNGDSDGQATASATGGIAPYTYSWNTGGTSATQTWLGAGTYSVTVTDQNGCTDSSSTTLTQPNSLVSSANVSSTIDCNGNTNGQVTASATGGTGSYTYSWNTGGTSATETGLGAGTYSVTITDQNGCFDSASTTLSQPASLVASSVVDSNISCNGATDGGATASATGGTMPYTYSWSNSATTASITGVGAGTYSVTITDNNGCFDSASINITEPVSLTAGASVNSNLSCNGGNDGQALASATGGTGSYTYSWNNGATSALNTGLSAGTYSVTITDQNGCFDSASTILTQPTSLVSSASVSSALDCNGDANGQVTASATGGTGSYTYSWNTGGTSATETGLGAGTYSVTITDQNGCFDSASTTLSQPASLVASSVVDSNISCNGATDGGATASATGGTMPYTYSWSNSATTASITGVGAGTYSVTITDNNGCFDSTSLTITEPASLVASSVADSNISCNGASDGGATALATGGTAPYNYMWSNSATTASITGVLAGTYSVTITDNNGCFDSTSLTITEPAMLTAASVVDSNVSCNGASGGGATASATGGTMPYTYSWSNAATTASITGVAAGTYSVTITDNNGCFDSTSLTITESASLVASSIADSNISCNGGSNGGATALATGGTMPYTYSWSNAATTASITGVASGTYSVTITDNNGCFDSTSLTITEPASLVASSVADSNVSCNGANDGGATASATGGTAPYNYMWSNAATTASITGVPAGTYSVTVTDNNGCFDSTSLTITEPASLVASSIADSNVSCNGASDGGATASATGGTMSYTYSWSNAATTASITGVAAGTYSVTITDNNGCFDSTSVTITEPAILAAASVVDSNVSCNGASDGGATASATGGTAPYNYMWSNSATTASITGVSAGTYSVTITDNNGCFDSTSLTITEPASLVASSVADSNVSCNGASDGGATASATGGTAPYNYMWSNAATTASITGVPAGTYSVTVTDNNGCFDSVSLTITEPAMLTAASVVDSNISCNGGSNGGATASATGGTAPYNYMWSNAATTASISGIAAGTYSVTITDDNGCFDSTSVTITEPTALGLTVSVNDSVSCPGGSDGEITSVVTGGTAPYSYLWSNSATTSTVSNLSVGTYVLTVTDGNGCTIVDSVSLEVGDDVNPVVQTQNITVYLDNSGSAPISTTDIDNGSSDNCSIDNLSLDVMSFTCADTGSNTVTLTATDVSGNMSSATATVTVEDTTSPVVATQNITVYLDNTGSASIATTDIDNGSSDNCSIDNLSLDVTSFTCADTGSNTVTLTATDVSGNMSLATATVTVEDTTSPVVQTQNITVYLDNSGSASIATTDIDNGSSDNCSIDNLSLDVTNFTCADTGANTVTLTATDVSGNMSSATATVTVEDTTSPVVATQNVTVYLDNSGSASISTTDIDNGSNDNCSIDNLSLDVMNFTCADTGANTVTLTATDVSGNMSSATATVTVEDTTSPVVAKQNVTVYLDNAGSASIATTDVDNGSNDNCSIDNLSLDVTNFTCADTGSNTVSLTATDVSGNMSSATATVTVEDTTSPVVATQNVTVYLDNSGSASISTTDIDNGSNDNCSIDNLSLDVTSFTCADTGANSVTLTATDVSGNTSSATATVTVEDTTSPVVATQNVTVYLDNAGSASISTTDIDNGSSDNCSIDNLSLDVTNFTCADTGSNTVTLTATDVSGNMSSATATVTVEDTTSPVVQTQNITVYLDNAGTASIATTDIDNGSSDNCSIDTMSLDITTFSCADTGSQNVVLTVVDEKGNTSSNTATVTVLDTIAPVITCPADIEICEGEIQFTDATSTDNCVSTVISTGSIFTGDSLSAGSYQLTFEAVDLSGNTATCATDVTVNPLPMVNLGADTGVGPQHIVSFSTGYPNATNVWSTGETTENISVQVEMDTTIWVSVTDSNSCAATDTVEVTILTGSEEHTFTAEVKLYPNPTRGNVNLQVSGMEENMLYSVLDQTGRELQRGRIVNGQNRIEMSDYANALYFIKLSDKQGEMIKVYRIVKH
ncbi:T9SS type A sorting domain-containing protein [Salibacter halophilus]|uniref:T9SS type A sorting domain-containing protein n=1 Tax=Salibacter halophilus TaxID=1803916 RepID=A0A6N6MB29_9FLAO|nr:T9SS type A sorting domain-containing protein [Salibacter halophilus]KAB1065647.1 T9SS type A sorting domain-containing protein [Salibacter halophilus]